MNQSKTCSKCGQLTPLENFRKSSKAKDGLQSACKPCQKAFYRTNADYYRAKVMEYKQANYELVKARGLAYSRRNAEKGRQRAKEWALNHPERAKATRRKVYDRNRETNIQRSKLWKQQNPERAKHADLMSVHRRRVRIALNGSFQVTRKEVESMRNQPCAYCGATGRNEIDHVIPLNRGGTHSIGNLVPACRPCNASKADKTITEWRKRKSPRA